MLFRSTHELAVSDGSTTDRFAVTVVAPASPRYELGSGDPLNVVDRDNGLSYILGGPVGSLQFLYASLSSAPSSNSYVSLGLGNSFTELYKGGRYVIPVAGWLQVNIPSSALPDPGISGMIFYSQTLEFAPPAPFDVCNLQSITLVQ